MVTQQQDFDRFMSAISFIEGIDQSGVLHIQSSPDQNEEQIQQRVLRSRTVLKSRTINNESMECLKDPNNNDLIDHNSNITKHQKKRNASRTDSIVDKENTPVSSRTQPKRIKKSITVYESKQANTNIPAEPLQLSVNKYTGQEIEVANILCKSEQQHVEVPRRSHVGVIQHNVSVNELEHIITPSMKVIDEKMDVTLHSPDSDFEKSIEISLRVYNKEDTTEKFQIENDLSPPASLTRTPTEEILKKNPFNITLNMSCHSDTSYDLAEQSPFRDLEEELDANNNLVMSHPKLTSFIVTSDLNAKFGLDNEKIYTPASKAVLDELNILNESGLMNFKRTLSTTSTIASYKDNYNWKIFNNLFTNNGKGADNMRLEGVKAADINLNDFTSPLLMIEQEAEALEEAEETDENSLKTKDQKARQKPKVDKVDTKKVKEEMKFIRKPSRTNNNPEAKDLDFVFAKCQEIFTLDELSTGIFCEVNKKGKIVNRSKVRMPLCEEKVYRLKEELSRKLAVSGTRLEDAWYFIRSDLNKMLYSQFKSKIKKEKA